MLASLIALIMVSVWVTYVALSVAAIADGNGSGLLLLAIATPIVLAAEWLGFVFLDRTVKFG